MKYKSSLLKVLSAALVAAFLFSVPNAEAATVSLKCQTVGATYVTRAGNSYTANAFAAITSVQLVDIGDLIADGCAQSSALATASGGNLLAYAPAADSATTNNGSKVTLAAPIDTTGTNTHNALDLAVTVADSSGGTNTVNGIKFENYTGDTSDNVNAINIGTSDGLGTAYAIKIGTGWDNGIATDSGLLVNTTSGTAVTALRHAVDTIVSGQVAKTTTLTGVTASSHCVASPNEIPSNAGYIKSVAPGTDQVIVTVNTDPGASNLDFTLICFN